MKKLMLLLLFVIVGIFMLKVVDMRDVVYATREDTLDLYMTIYEPVEEVELKSDYVIVYVHGGGFMMGSRTESEDVEFCRVMAERGYRVASIDYRLGMEGFYLKGMKLVRAVQSAIYKAVEDCASAVVYLINEEGIDADKIILAGLSAGAIIALQTDYMHSNGSWYTAMLPDTLRFAGVIAYSGAVLSVDGLVKYARKPAPTMMFHGTKDNIVTYNTLSFFNYGLYGTKPMMKRLKKYDCPYYVRRYKDLSHEVCHYALYTLDEIEYFIKKYVIEEKNLMIDELYKSADIQSKIEHYDELRYEFTHKK